MSMAPGERGEWIKIRKNKGVDSTPGGEVQGVGGEGVYRNNSRAITMCWISDVPS